MLQDDVAKERGLSPQTVMNHLASAMEAGYFVDYRRGRCIHFMYMKVSLLCLICFKAGLTFEKESVIQDVIRKEPICSGK